MSNKNINLDKTITELNLQNSQENSKKSCSKKTLIIIGISAFLVIAAIVTIIIVFATKKDDDKKRTIADNQETETDLIDYDEAEKLIDLEKNKENHKLLNNISENIKEIIPICSNTNFAILNETINELPDNLDFLKNTTNSSLLIVKEDLNLYMISLSDITKQTNNITKEMNKMINNISSSLEEYQKEIDNMTKQYEKNIQYLAIPLKYNSSILRNLQSDKGLLSEYKKHISNLINSYSDEINYRLNNIKFIGSGVKSIVENMDSLIIKRDELHKNLWDILKETSGNLLFNLGTKLKNLFIEYHDNIDIMKNEIASGYKEVSDYVSSLNEEETDILENLQNIIGLMGDNILNMIPASLNLISLTGNNKHGIKTTIIVSAAILGMELMIDNLNKIEIQATTSLDLLFILDVTGSMQPYLDEIKKNLINIITGIEEQCPGIDVNLGFIGYRDFGEKYTDIEFNKNHTLIKEIINKLKTSGGKYYYPDEDVAFALDLALNKGWKSNAKLAVFIADAPGHGLKYGGHEVEDMFPKRREIDEMISEFVERGISLFCLKITNKTDIMFKVFEDIYNQKLPNNPNFLLLDNNNAKSFINTIIEYATKVYTDQRNVGEENCLLDKKTAIEILKSKYGIDNKNPDDNLRFILGKCNPVLLVPGVYATKLKVEFNCKGLSTYEKDTTLKNIRLFCGNDVCKDESKESEEHPLLFALLNPVFGIEASNSNKYGACLGHISNYFQNEEECPKVDGKSICYYSKYVKVGYYGGTTETVKESRCGVEGITKVVQTGDLLLDSYLSLVVNVADSFNTISKNLVFQGYKEGFSLGAVPNDFRRYLATNNFASEVFKYQINRLYENTGKPVVIVAHSYGTLLTLTNLLKNEKDKTFLKKVKKFIAMAPPFSGSTKLLDVFLHGNQDFIDSIKNYHIFAQYLQYKSLPTTMELRPKSIAARIFIDPEYQELGDAIRNRLEIERDCEAINCDISLIREKTQKFDEIFKSYFPSLLDSECEFEKNIKGVEESLKRKCYTYIYNVGDCPTIIKKSVKPTEDNFKKDFYCKTYGDKYFYQGECNDSRRNCLDRMYYSDKCPNPYNIKGAVDFLIKRFNKDFKKKYGTIDKSYFETHEKIREGIKKSIEHQNEKDLIEELPVPPVDTELVYGSFYKTLAALILDDNDFTKFEKQANFEKGGDNTVQTWSSLLTGLKWIYDIKKNNLTQKIKLVEYCSRLANSGQYKYNQNIEQNFSAISCECLDQKSNEYKDIKGCAHATMLHDKYLFNYIYSIVNNAKNNIYDSIENKVLAAKKYKSNFDYTQQCNNDLYNFLNKVK